MTLEEITDLLETIECGNSAKQAVTDCLCAAAIKILKKASAWNESPSEDWWVRLRPRLDLINDEFETDLLEKLKLAKMLSNGLVCAGEFEAGWHLDLKRLSITVIYYKEAFWVPEWVKVAIDWYRRNDGFAGMKFKKYISKMRTVEDPGHKPYFRSAPKNAPPHIRMRGLPEDEEDEPNYRRKVRDKAPRIKRGMGRI